MSRRTAAPTDPELARYLAAHPGKTARDWKGKGRVRLTPISPGEQERAALARFLAAHPNRTARDFKGKGKEP